MKSRVTYSPNVKFTVVLAFKSLLKEAWHTANSSAYKNVQKLLENEFVYHNSNTLLARKVTEFMGSLKSGKKGGPKGAMAAGAKDSDVRPSQMLSVRLLPNLRNTMRARKSNMGAMMKTKRAHQLVNNVDVQEKSSSGSDSF